MYIYNMCNVYIYIYMLHNKYVYYSNMLLLSLWIEVSFLCLLVEPRFISCLTLVPVASDHQAMGT